MKPNNKTIVTILYVCTCRICEIFWSEIHRIVNVIVECTSYASQYFNLKKLSWRGLFRHGKRENPPLLWESKMFLNFWISFFLKERQEKGFWSNLVKCSWAVFTLFYSLFFFPLPHKNISWHNYFTCYSFYIKSRGLPLFITQKILVCRHLNPESWNYILCWARNNFPELSE